MILPKRKAKMNCVANECPSNHPSEGYCWNPSVGFRCPQFIHGCLVGSLQLPAGPDPNNWIVPMPIPSGCSEHPCTSSNTSLADWCKSVAIEMPILLEQVEPCFWRWAPNDSIDIDGDCWPWTGSVKTVVVHHPRVELSCTIHNGVPSWRLFTYVRVEYVRCKNVTCQELESGQPALCPQCQHQAEWSVNMYRPINLCKCGRCPPIDNDWPQVDLPPLEAIWCKCCEFEQNFPCLCSHSSCEHPQCEHEPHFCDDPAFLRVLLDCQDCECEP